jgi:hypothetical protein
MPSAVFRTMRMLEEARLHYSMERTGPDSIRLLMTMAGQRVEIDIFEDDHIEISRFFGDERVEGGSEILERILTSA